MLAISSGPEGVTQRPKEREGDTLEETGWEREEETDSFLDLILGFGIKRQVFESQSDKKEQVEMPNFTGTWKMKSSENFEELLKALGKWFSHFILHYVCSVWLL